MARDRRYSGANRHRTSPLELVGKTVVVDVTYADQPDVVPARRRQFYGVVANVTNRTIILRLTCGGVLHLPPDVSVFEPAPSGARRLASTGEHVAAADFAVEVTAHGPYGASALRVVEAAG
ncbi:MAG TPA: hypothetical protein VM784_13895 [Actinomycetota bacterium]|nr:hypothetical protein [Actinomycetota bacterium]